MQKLLDFSLKYSANSILQKSYDPTYERISFLLSNAKYILSIVIMHGGEIDVSLLGHIIDSSIDPLIMDYDKQIKNLLEYEILEKKGVNYSVTHAALTDSWHNHKKELDKFNLLAYRNCSAYYNCVLDDDFSCQENIEQALLFLLKIYSQYEPEKIIEVVDKMSYMVSERVRPEQIFEYFQIFLNYTEEKEELYTTALYKMMLFCFNYGLFKNCLYLIQIIEKINSEVNKYILFVYKVNCFEYLGLHQDSIDLCESQLENKLCDRQKYICYLLLLGCHRSLNQMDKVADYVEKINSIPNYKSFDEYGIFLRLSEVYMSRKDALPLVKESVSFYKDRNWLLEAKSRITYSFLLAVTDDLAEAENELSLCFAADSNTHYWDSILFLNQASIFILQEKFGQKTSGLLKKAELSTNSSFDLLLILTLQLINSYEFEKRPVDDYLLKRIARLMSHESDKHLIALVAYDLYIYYSETGECKLSDEFYKIAQKTCCYNETVSYQLQRKINPNTPNLFNTKWCIGFTFFWNVDYEDYNS